MRRISWFFIAWLSAASLCGCETVQGFGRDIQNAGASVEHALTNSHK